MARPKVSQADKRSVKVSFRLTEAEQTQLIKRAEACGLATGVFIREKLLKGRFPVLMPPKVDVAVYLELKKIGVNVNQLAKQVNSGRMPFGILAILDKLMSQLERMIKLLLDDSRSADR